MSSLLACSVFAQPARQIEPDDLTDEHVQRAIEVIAAELAARMDERTLWEPARPPGSESAQPGGYTALAALALLYAGESYQGERLRDAVEHLAALEMDGVYAIALRASLWAALPARFNSFLQEDASRLVRGFSPAARGWDYRMNPRTQRQDNSIRQFGALGLWEAAQRGVNVPRPLWQALEQAYIDMQLADGGWNYTGSGPATGAMTAAGLATLFITQDYLHADRFVNIAPPRRQPQPQPNELAIERGLDWMNRHFTADANPGNTARTIRSQYFYYYLYGVERVALASGYKYLGGRDWFREGAAEIIHRFCSWDEDSRTMTAHRNTYGDGRRAALRTDDLAFGLMFLSRGRVPVAVNKLRDESVPWNNRPRDVANFTAWLRDETATELNWQIADISAEPESWLDAPLLYFASHRGVPWAGEGSAELAKIKRYLDLGGMLLAVGEGGGRQFADSIETAGRLMYPHLEWRTLDANHWAFTAHTPVDRARPRLRALSNGVRDLIIVSSDDFSATFQGRRERQIAHYQTVANIYFYASEMNRPKPRLSAQSPATLLEGIEPAPHVKARIVQVTHGGEHEVSVFEPLALEVFAEALKRAGDLHVTVDHHPLLAISTLSPRPNAVLLTGSGEASFADEQRKAIRDYVEAGGVIIVEEAGGRTPGEFVRSAEAMAEELFGAPVQPMREHAIITGEGIEHAMDLSGIEYRPYSMVVTGSIETAPRLRGFAHSSGGVMLFSRDDLSHALLDQPCWGVNGYSPRSARLLLRNILLYAAMDRE